MLIKIYEGVVINAKAIVGIIPRVDSVPALYEEAVYKGWWLWKKEVKPRTEVRPITYKYYLKLTYIDAVRNIETWLEWTDNTLQERDTRSKHITEIIMNFDDNYVNRAFENEVLK